MSAFLLTWNPKKWDWTELPAAIATILEIGEYETNWSCAGTKQIRIDDRVFLLRQGVEPRGIVGAGRATSEPYDDEHWNPKEGGRPTRYVDVVFTDLFDAEAGDVLPLDVLKQGKLASVHWSTPGSGINIPDDAAEELEALWEEFTRDRVTFERQPSDAISPDEVPNPSRYPEGAVERVPVNKYERNPKARQACIDHYGRTCVICHFNFAETYGELAERIVHVHHLVPLSQVGRGYEIDPIRDLIPVCPNCHAVIHSVNPPWSPEHVVEMLREGRERAEGQKVELVLRSGMPVVLDD